MGGPSISRSATNTAPLPGLTNQYQSLLQGLFSGGQGFGGLGQPSALQQQIGNTYANQLSQPTAQQRTFESALPQLLGMAQSFSPQGVLDASQPIFQRNLQLTADTLRQAGPRFASNTERLVGEYGNRAMQDYNLFAQQAIQNAAQTRLGAFQTLGGLGQGADTSLQGLLGGAGQFGNQMAGINQGSLMQLLGLGAQVGTGPAALLQSPGGFANIMSLLGGLGGLGIGLFGMGGPFGKTPNFGGGKP